MKECESNKFISMTDYMIKFASIEPDFFGGEIDKWVEWKVSFDKAIKSILERDRTGGR